MSSERTGSADRLKAYLDEARSQVRSLSPEQAQRAQDGGALLIDIRESWETAGGSAAGAVLIERGQLELEIGRHAPDPEQSIVLMCAAGNRSALSVRSLEAMGYRKVANLSGGWNAWCQAGLPTERPRGLDDRARQRYLRHLAIEDIGEAGQRKLLDSRVFIAGAGGLGSPAALYLAAAGVGRISLVDDDRVERSNLQRQILHSDHLIGHPKTESAAQRLHALNPDIQVETFSERITQANVDALIRDHDVVIDGSDNFPTRYLLNDACVRQRLPLVYGAVLRFAGQLAVFRAGDGRAPCYRCLFPQPPAPEDSPSCAEAGVLGVMPGVIGTLQAAETLKLLLDLGQPLVSRLLHYDALAGGFRETRLVRDPDCNYCAIEPR